MGRPGADIYDLVFLCIDCRAIHHVLLTWPMLLNLESKKTQIALSIHHVVNPRDLVFLDGGDAS